MTADNPILALALALLLCGCTSAPLPSVAHTSSVGSGGEYIVCEAPSDLRRSEKICLPPERWMLDYRVIHMPKRGCPAGWKLQLGTFQSRATTTKKVGDASYVGHDTITSTSGCWNPALETRYMVDVLVPGELIVMGFGVPTK